MKCTLEVTGPLETNREVEVHLLGYYMKMPSVFNNGFGLYYSNVRDTRMLLNKAYKALKKQGTGNVRHSRHGLQYGATIVKLCKNSPSTKKKSYKEV